MSVTDDRIFTHDDAQSLLTKQTDIKNSIDALTTAVGNQTTNMVDRSNNQSIDGVKTFSSAPVITEVIPDSDNSTKAATTSWIESVFFNKLVAKLAASTAASISSLNTSSLFYRMLSWALTAAGVQYNFNNSSAWYICFGSLLGGLIVQGGKNETTTGAGEFITLPISFSGTFSAYVVPIGTAGGKPGTVSAEEAWPNQMKVWGLKNSTGSLGQIGYYYLAFGR